MTRFRRARSDQDGFTLIELLVALSTAGLILAALTIALVVSMKVVGRPANASVDPTSFRTAESHDAQLTAAYFANDVANSGSGGGSAPTYSVAAPSCVTGSLSGATAILNLSWVDHPESGLSTNRRASYIVSGSTLHRAYCIGSSFYDVVVAHNLSSSALNCTPSPCGGTATRMVLSVVEQQYVSDPTSTKFSFDVTGDVGSFVGGTTPPGNPPPPPGAQVPLLLLGSGPGVLTLGDAASSLSVVGKAVIDSSSTGAINMQNNSHLAGSYYLPGGTCTGSSNCPAVQTHSAIPNPYANVPAPTCSGAGSNSGGSLTPGTFSSLTLKNGTFNLAPGVYCITGDLNIKSATVVGNGVLLYIQSGAVSLDTNSNVTLTADTTGTSVGSLYAGVIMWQDAADGNPLSFSGSSTNSTYSGTIYAPAAPVTLQGGSDYTGLQLIASSLSEQGSGTLTIG
jgi:type II secretory pathway pseudopilin PulG